MRSRGVHVFAYLFVLIVLIEGVQRASALNVTLNFNAAASESPPFDPMVGNMAPAGLRSLMEYAELYYEDAIQDFHNLTINYWYEDLGGSTIGFNSIVATDIPGDPARRVIEANIRIDTRVGTGGDFRNYFIDPTPENDSEFAMQQVLWRDISSVQRDQWYNDFGAGIPDTFEVGYRGLAVDAGPADGRSDMLSVVLHEFGHSLGVPDLNPIAQDDLDYDFSPAFVFGQSLAAVVAASDNPGHLLGQEAVMNPSIGTSIRDRPGHTDFFAMASGNDYFVLDVPRREYYGGASWNTSGNWSGNRVPDAQDDSYVRDGHSTTLTSANGTAGNLWIQEGAAVSTGTQVLTVTDKITVEGVNPGSQANLVVNSGGRVVADEIELNQGGLLTVTAGGGEQVDADLIDINPGSALLGNGSVRINSLLQNDGAITAIAGAGDELVLLTGPVDLDGSAGNGQVFAVLGNLRISASLNDAFDGEMTIGAGRQVQVFGSSFQIGQNAASDAELILQGGDASTPATFVKSLGSATFVGGTLRVTGRGIVEGNAIFEAGSNTEVPSNGHLTFRGPVTYRGGSHQGAGMVVFEGGMGTSVLVEQNTTLQISRVDLDGNSGTTPITMDNALLTLAVDWIDLGIENRFDGSLQLNGQNAGLVVNLPFGNGWQMDGVLNTTGSAGILPQLTLQGSPVRVSGVMNMDGISTISAPMTVSGSIVMADAATDLRLSGGPHQIENTASITGPGELRVGGDGHLLVNDNASIDAIVLNGGRFEPGPSIGTVSLKEDFTQTSIGTIAMEIAGDPFVNQDLLFVGGEASVDGAMEVTAINGLIPTIGSIYTLISAPSVVGTFDTLTTLSDSIVTFSATLLYSATTVRLAIQDVALFGDFNDDLVLDCADVDALVAEIVAGGMGTDFDLNGDSAVDALDLNLWLDEAGTFNVGGPYLGGDANLDGVVDGSDFGVWNSNKFTFGNGWCGGDFSADGATDGSDFGAWNANKFRSSTIDFISDSSTTVVPEPMGLTFVVFLLIAARQRDGDPSDRVNLLS